MKPKFNQLLIVCIVCLFANAASYAGNEPARPLGYTIGQSTYEQVERELRAKTRVQNSGLNTYTRGPMLTADGDLGIENLKKAVFIFNPDKRLAAVQLTFYKRPLDANFDPLFRLLSSKYTVIKKHIPFVGDKSVTFRQGEVLIDLVSEHMGFEILMLYRTADFDAAYEKQKRLEQQQQSGQQQKNL